MPDLAGMHAPAGRGHCSATVSPSECLLRAPLPTAGDMADAIADGTPRAALDTFPKLLLDHALRRGARPANREKDFGIWQSWSWAEVKREIEALACGLASMGFARGDRLAIIGD